MNNKTPVNKKTAKAKLFAVISYPFNAIKNLGLKTRFSISFRITLQNMRLLLQYSVLAVIAVIVGMILVFSKNIPFSRYHDFTRSLRIEETKDIEEFCRTENISIRIYNNKNQRVYEYPDSFIAKEYLPIPYAFHTGQSYYLSLPYAVRVGEQTYHANLYIDVSFYVLSGLSILKILAVSLLVIILLIGYRSSKVAKNLLSPLRELSQTLRQISESNMTSRINITDCKYELKEIAQSFNQMMDSIEASYQKQKQFVSDASHELRTPISVIQGYAHMLNRWGKNDPKVMEEAIEAIMEETENMKDLVEKLLFIARSDKSTFQLEKTPFDLSSLVSDLIKEFSLIAPKKQFVFKPFASPVVTADKNRIKEAYRIIMDNAVKYTGSNGVITLSVFLEGNFACVSIADNGPGIPKEELPKIFDRFYSRNRGSKEAESKSHGLGLALAKIIVLAHGGKITVKSTLNIGTEFIVKIPVK
ncbi:MAG: HAMP domain-containing histidine kinase [Clostridiaceae bacterium]|nr:HAMP domain-containing histidine kinase [Clostridiaceae bacterium]